MPGKAHMEEQMVTVLRQGEAGEKVADICRKVGISERAIQPLRMNCGRKNHELRALRD
jgi:hypothetical protein